VSDNYDKGTAYNLESFLYISDEGGGEWKSTFETADSFLCVGVNKFALPEYLCMHVYVRNSEFIRCHYQEELFLFVQKHTLVRYMGANEFALSSRIKWIQGKPGTANSFAAIQGCE